MKRVDVGDIVRERVLVGMSSERVRIPDHERLVHLQFRRFGGCPVCNLHLHSIARRHDEIARAGILEVAVFHSTAEALLPYHSGLPFSLIPDPDKVLYAELGVEQSALAMVHPRAMAAVVKGMAGMSRLPGPPDHGGAFGLPADFLIAPDGRVVARKYGEHAYDQWSVDEILSLAERAGASEVAEMGAPQ